MHCFTIDYSVLLYDCVGVFDRQVFLKVSALYCSDFFITYSLLMYSVQQEARGRDCTRVTGPFYCLAMWVEYFQQDLCTWVK